MFSFFLLLHLCSIAGNILQSPHCNLPAYTLNASNVFPLPAFHTIVSRTSPPSLNSWRTPSFVTKCVRIKHCTTRSYFLQFVTHLILKQITDSLTFMCVREWWCGRVCVCTLVCMCGSLSKALFSAHSSGVPERR